VGIRRLREKCLHGRGSYFEVYSHSLPLLDVAGGQQCRSLGSMQSDLQVLVGADGKPLWDGMSAVQAREATPAQHTEWEQSRDQAIQGEIDLDAGNDPDEWNVYLISIPRMKKGSV
jgi:hypothetical protein